MNVAQKDLVHQHRSDIVEVLKTYSDTTILWLCNQGYLNASAEDEVSSNKTKFAKATHILECLVAADNGWVGLMECLEHHSNGNLARTLHSKLTSKQSHISNHIDNLVFTQAESSKCVPSEMRCVTPVWLAHLRDQLRSFYTTSFARVRLFPNDHASAVHLEKIWVNLSIATYKEEEAHEDYLKALNVAFESGLPIIIKGEPGIGKTTLMLKICYDWAIGKLPQFELVICGKLRAVPEADTLLDISLEWTRSRCPAINVESLKTNLGGSKLNLLVILNGYDESICHCNEVEQLLQSTESFHLPFRLVVTTRPYKLYEIVCPHHLLIVRGFSLSQQLQFVENFSKLQKKEAISVQKKIQSTASLSSLCRIPLFMYFICCLSDNESVDGSMTKLLFLLCESLISRHETLTQTSTALTNWRESKWIASLGALALYGLKDFVDGKLCFDKADLDKYSIDSNNVAYSVGFLNKEEVVARTGRSRRVSVSFPHKLFQEFFAALALSNNISTPLDSLPAYKNPLQEFFQMLKRESHKRLEMQQVLIFLTGMESGRAGFLAFLGSNEIRFAPSLEDELTLLQQLRIEYADQLHAIDLVNEIRYRSRLYKQSLRDFDVFLHNDVWRLSVYTAITSKEDSCRLLFWDESHTWFTRYDVNTLDEHTVVDHLRNNLHQLKKAWFAGTEQYLAKVAKILQMSQLPLNEVRIAVERGGGDARVAWPAMDTLTKVVIESTDGVRTEVVPPALQSLLEAHPAIKAPENQHMISLDCHCWPNTTTHLIFCKVNFDAALASQLCQALDRLRITYFGIRKASLQLEAFPCLCHALSKQCLLKALHLESIRMDGLQSPRGCHIFGECFVRLTFLHTFYITDCGITDAVAECLLPSFQAVKDLCTLSLEFNPLSQAMKIKLFQCFKHQNVEL